MRLGATVLLSRQTLWLGGRFGFCCRGSNRLVPTAGRRVDGGRFIGLRYSHERLCVQPRTFQLLRVEPHGDLVALASRVVIAAFCGQREPFVSLGKVALDADAPSVKNCKIVL